MSDKYNFINMYQLEIIRKYYLKSKYFVVIVMLTNNDLAKSQSL